MENEEIDREAEEIQDEIYLKEIRGKKKFTIEDWLNDTAEDDE